MLMPAGEVCPTVVPAPLGLGDDITSNGVCCACYRFASCASPVLLFAAERPLLSCPAPTLCLSCTSPLPVSRAHAVRNPMLSMHYSFAGDL